jgi:hypothetical protein
MRIVELVKWLVMDWMAMGQFLVGSGIFSLLPCPDLSGAHLPTNLIYVF